MVRITTRSLKLGMQKFVAPPAPISMTSLPLTHTSQIHLEFLRSVQSPVIPLSMLGTPKFLRGKPDGRAVCVSIDLNWTHRSDVLEQPDDIEFRRAQPFEFDLIDCPTMDENDPPSGPVRLPPRIHEPKFQVATTHCHQHSIPPSIKRPVPSKFFKLPYMGIGGSSQQFSQPNNQLHRNLTIARSIRYQAPRGFVPGTGPMSKTKS